MATKKTAKKATKPFKFQKAAERSEAKPAVLCPADRVLNLYNQDSGKSAKKISKKVRDWFTDEAMKDGWDAVGFIPEVQSQHGAGCVLLKSPNGKKASSTSLIKKLGSDTE